MGLIGKVLSFTRVERNGAKLSDVKVDLGGGDIITAEYSHSSGDDSFPLVGDLAVLEQIPRSGGMVVVSFVESDSVQKSSSGDRRIYSRDDARGEVAEVWLKNDGTITTRNDQTIHELRPDGTQRSSNSSGYFELRSDGTVDINGVTISPAGLITTPTGVVSPSVVANSKELAGHDHPAGTPPGNTGPNN